MKLDGACVLLTGASGGIGQALATALAAKGAHLLLSGRSVGALQATADRVAAQGGQASVIEADLLSADGPEQLLQQALLQRPCIDVLINCAGAMHFGTIEQTSVEVIDRLWRMNVQAPMRLAQAVLPGMRKRGQGLIVNVGSIFGSIAFPCFAAYSASKFALRGFSEALRREIGGSGVEVLYVAPRYTRTAMNAGAAARMAQALGMNQDEPQRVAAQIVRAIESRQRERFFGWPEALFVRINAIFPRWVDASLRGQTQRMRPYALENAP